ncbi:hypothetical protein SMD20_34060 [Nonomuraea sp. LP-02]|uniref:hypothetical protein n=1 Tax=Nonomuraea sp. LP-02 TaxID=3097960 RepID=UPI002E37B7EC|nr:hypothetical protein [Nonomuraea sp. LP-02]MED7929313.1 hypothetical protein [Nonomuraea sp. LP-02]
MWHGDADAPLSEHERAQQQAAERAALIQFGRNTAPKLPPASSVALVDVDGLTDGELAQVRRMAARWCLASSRDTPFGEVMAELAKALQRVEQERAFRLMQFIYGAEVPPDWDTAVAALDDPEE